MNDLNLAILILAAGASKRMGDIKQLLPYKNTTLLGHAIDQAKRVSSHINIVLGANSTKIKERLPDDVTLIENLQWEKGMGTSVSAGVQVILKTEKFNALLIMLADQPLIESNDLETLIESFVGSSHHIVATAYNDKYGPPAIFDKQLFLELAALNADFGAQNIMDKYAAVLKTVHLDGKTFDIDTPEAYNKLLIKQNNK